MCIYMRIYIGMYMILSQDAEEVVEGIQNALNLVMITTERKGNMKELKQNICETLSTPRN